MEDLAESLRAAVGHHQAGRLALAEQLYRQILAVQPRHADALHLLGVTEAQGGRPEEAVDWYRQAIDVCNSRPDFHHHLGQALQALGRDAEARKSFERSLELDPSNAAAHFHLALLSHGSGELAEAERRYAQALALWPDFVEARVNLGDLLRSQGRLAEAADAYQAAARLRPQAVEIQHNLGATLVDLERFDEAILALGAALALRPRLAEAHYNLGRAYKGLQRPDDSQACWQQALEIRPEFDAAWYALANLLTDREQLDQAAEAYQAALRFAPDDADTLTNYGKLLHKLGRTGEAVELWDRAIQANPAAVEAHFSRAMIRLREGDFAGGWADYAWRVHLPKFPLPVHNAPRWQGEPLGEVTLLVQAEQGLGDTLQFIRYLELLKSLAKHVIARVQAPLVPLLCHSGFDVIGDDRPLPAFHWQVPLLDLPRILGTDLSNLPARIPYLAADQSRTDRWRDTLRSLAGFKIGVAWQGSRHHVANRQRSFAPGDLRPVARVPGVRLISLQLGAEEESRDELSALGIVTLAGLDSEGSAFMDSAAVIRQLDLVITVDSAIAHLAGGLAARAWVALAASADWRWLADRDDSPWYPSLRLFRQATPGDWSTVFETMAAELAADPKVGLAGR